MPPLLKITGNGAETGGKIGRLKRYKLPTSHLPEPDTSTGLFAKVLDMMHLLSILAAAY